MATNVSVAVGGQNWTAWVDASVQYGAEQAARHFSLTSTDGQTFANRWDFMPGTPVKVSEGGVILVTGIIDKMTPSYSADAHSIAISGRSNSKDTIDSSVEHDTGEFRDKTILDIANALDKQGVGFSSNLSTSDMPKIPYFRINPHETVFEAIDRIARKQQLLLIGQADGGILIDKGGSTSVNAPLIEGQNIECASACFDESKKHSKYTCKGQKTKGSSKADLQMMADAKDSSIKRNRPKTFSHESEVDQSDLQKRADNHRDRQFGESISACIKVRDWRDANGLAYKENSLIPVYSPMLKIQMAMIIAGVHCTKGEHGSFTELTLKHPKALGSKANAGSGADAAWSPGF